MCVVRGVWVGGCLSRRSGVRESLEALTCALAGHAELRSDDPDHARVELPIRPRRGGHEVLRPRCGSRHRDVPPQRHEAPSVRRVRSRVARPPDDGSGRAGGVDHRRVLSAPHLAVVDALARSLSPKPLHCSGPQGRPPFDSSEKERFLHTVMMAELKFVGLSSPTWRRCSREPVGNSHRLGRRRVPSRRRSGWPTASREHRTRCRDPGDQSHVGLPTPLARRTCTDSHRTKRPVLNRST